MDNKKILVVDDEPDIVSLVSYNLKREGFAVDPAYDGEEALMKMKNGNYGLMILDQMLPGIQGMELCRLVRKDPAVMHVPIIMLSAKGDEMDKVLGLEMGADDYIAKPFSPRELIARVRAVLRRQAQKEERPLAGRMLKAGGLEIDTERYIVIMNGKNITLSSTEFKLLLYLCERRGRVFTREQLLDAVWGNEAFVEPRTVDVHIRRLRSRIENDPASPVYIKTLRGIGYFMEKDL